MKGMIRYVPGRWRNFAPAFRNGAISRFRFVDLCPSSSLAVEVSRKESENGRARFIRARCGCARIDDTTPTRQFDEGDQPTSPTGGAVANDTSRIVNDNAPLGVNVLAERHRNSVDNCDGQLDHLIIDKIPLCWSSLGSLMMIPALSWNGRQRLKTQKPRFLSFSGCSAEGAPIERFVLASVSH